MLFEEPALGLTQSGFSLHPYGSGFIGLSSFIPLAAKGIPNVRFRPGNLHLGHAQKGCCFRLSFFSGIAQIEQPLLLNGQPGNQIPQEKALHPNFTARVPQNFSPGQPAFHGGLSIQ